MILVFNGRGGLMPVTALASMVLTMAVAPRSKPVFWAMLVLSGGVDHLLGTRWNSQPPTLLQDLRTGEVTERHPDHSFFWIPMQYSLWVKGFLAFSAVVAYLSGRCDR